MCAHKMLNQNDYERLLKEGKEIVVISNNENADSAIFWMSEDGKKVYCFNRNLGEFPHPKTARELAGFFVEEIISGESKVFVRGYRD